MTEPDGWESPQKILVLLAHPDDPDFFCGATLARWGRAGHHITECLITCGDKGTKERNMSAEELCKLRQREQRAAAKVLGVENLRFLGYPDGYLVPDLALRRDMVRVIRQEKPDVMVTCDPTTLYSMETRLNHPDHRAAGQAALDAVFPCARDHLYFPELLADEHLEPHVVREVWVAGASAPTVTLDVTDTWDIKLKALYEHKSQIGDPKEFTERMRNRRTPDSTPENPRYEEKFRRLILA